MKNGKLSALLDTPLGAVIAMGAVLLVAELLFMMLFHAFLVVQFKLSDTAWDFIDAVALAAAVSPALYFLVFRKMQESMERLRQINASALDAIVIVDEQATIAEWNLAAQGMFQYSREEAVGRQMHQLIAPSRYRADAARGFARFEETGGGPLIGKTTEVSAMRKDGSEFPAELSISAVKVKGHWHAMGIIRDITERKQAEATVRKLNAELEDKVAARTAELVKAWLEAEQASHAKSEFLAAMSHEIRTPMNGVIGMVDVLRQSSLNGPQMEMVNIIRDSAISLLGIINDILDFSKIEAGKLQIEGVPMDAAGVVEGVGETMDRLALKKGAELTLFTDPAIPGEVMGDPGRLRQILINLVSNAIKFSSGLQRPGRISVRAELSESNAERATVEFHVADNGIGMDEATLARLFTPFTQADVSTTRKFGGTGLGLVISHRLVELMGGEITVRSEPGQGSTFTVRLPFVLPPEPAAAPSPAAESPLAGLPCLVVDGPDGIAGDLAAYLVHGKAAVERAADMAAARQWMGRRVPGLCVVVIDTPAQPPLDDLRAIARSRPDIDVRFVVIGRGRRRRCRIQEPGVVALDAEAMHRRAFLEAVAVAAGRAEEQLWEGADGPVRAAPAPLSREEARREGSLILIAEDNEINQKVILQQLALLGRTADVADDGREALELWRSGDYAILLADLHMPEMDGYELAAAIRATEAGKTHIPIIAFTANALKGEAERCRAAGMDDYLSKPVQLTSLGAMLEKWLPAAAPASHPPLRGDGRGDGSKRPQEVMTSHPPLQGEGRGGDGLNPDEPRHTRISSPASAEPAPIPAFPLKGKGRSRAPLPAGEEQGEGGEKEGYAVPLDVSVLKAVVGDDPEVIRDFLHDFRLDAAKTAAELKAACARGEAAQAGALAHRLKSSARSMGALGLGELCAAMEQAGKAADLQALAALLPKFEAETAAVNDYLDAFRKNGEKS